VKIDFSGQVAIVTGAGGGIGRAVSLALADAGAKVLAVDLSVADGEQTAALVRERGGAGRFVAADVSQEADVVAYIADARHAWGRVDILMNNAGWQGSIQPLVDCPVEMFDKVMGINVRGVFLGLKHVLPLMLAARRGAVVNTASLAGYIGSHSLAPYTASKHAVLGLTKSAALEVARKGVRINAVCPGPVDTPMIDAIEAAQAPGDAQALRAKRTATIPDGRYAKPAEVANLMVYLASDYASHITGQGIQINGGSHG
jgi:NAD(P)-dependent dehydrogenase (short-subunit alcohol dehydrogenase family)